jgi:hypothetical protein
MNELDVIQFFPCEDAAINIDAQVGDLAYGWWEIKRPLIQAYMPPGVSKDFTATDLTFFFAVTGGMGEYPLYVEAHRLDLVNPRRNILLQRSELFMIRCPNESVVVQSAITIEELVFTNPGWYRFQLKTHGQSLKAGINPSEFFIQVFAGE